MVMQQESFAAPEYKEGIEADAVCGQCGSVNPEGTLICKSCGNNLRDQRLLRLTADQMLQGEGEQVERSVFLLRALPVLGMLVVLWLGLNAGRIASLLTTSGDYYGENTIVTRPDQFWEAEEGAVYESMARELTLHYPSESEAEAARMNAAPQDQIMSGYYALFERLGTNYRYAGAALIHTDGPGYYYVARLRGNIEIRGSAVENETFLMTQWDEGGLLLDGGYYAVSGSALVEPDGAVSVYGQSDYNTRNFQASAYRISGR